MCTKIRWTFILRLLFFGILIGATGCEKSINPYQYQIQDRDREKSEFYPSDRELTFRQKKMAFFIDPISTNVLQNRVDEISGLVEKVMISESQLTRAILAEENPDAIATVISSGNARKIRDFMRKEEIDYLNRISIQILSSSTKAGKDSYEAEAKVDIYSAVNGRAVIQEKFLLNSENSKKNASDLSVFTRLYFPKQGFIIEMRGNKKVAKISIGQSSGVKKGAKFILRKRTADQNVEKKGSSLVARSRIQYSDEIVAEGEIVLVMEDSAWLVLEDAKKDQPELGDVAFEVPN